MATGRVKFPTASPSPEEVNNRDLSSVVLPFKKNKKLATQE